MGGPELALLMFVTLVGLYSPVSSVAAYLPVLSRLPQSQHAKLALGLFVYVTLFVLAALWIGEVLLEVLGISTAALTTAGGIALATVAVPLMVRSPEDEPEVATGGTIADGSGRASPDSWQSVLLTPVTFPLTVGGATFGILVSFSALSHGAPDRFLLTAAGLAYAAVTAITLFISSHVHRRASARTRQLLDRIAGILLTSIAVTLLASGITRLVVDVLHGGGYQ
jgi:multiple antibiotic resistance protein